MEPGDQEFISLGFIHFKALILLGKKLAHKSGRLVLRRHHRKLLDVEVKDMHRLLELLGGEAKTIFSMRLEDGYVQPASPNQSVSGTIQSAEHPSNGKPAKAPQPRPQSNPGPRFLSRVEEALIAACTTEWQSATAIVE